MKNYIIYLILFSSSLQLFAQKAEFEHDVKTAKKPWTNLEFNNDPDNFQFAIVSDNTGGAREGVFQSALVKLNMMQPEFVISVGDLIEGYTEDTVQINKEWDEFDEWIEELEMPFFYLPGNHDITNKIMQADWEARFGVRYYSVVYKNVLFIMMDTNDSEEIEWYKMSDEQEKYILDVLEKHQKVRWTFFFMHHPHWTQEENELAAIEQKLQEEGRKYTMFAGHNHQYMHEIRQGKNYYVLATTGGGSKLRGPEFGEFDHVTWVTMSSEGPKMANLWLDGILEMDLFNAELDSMAKALTKASKIDHLFLQSTSLVDARILIRVKNTWRDSLQLDAAFFHNHQVNILNPRERLLIAPGDEVIFESEINMNANTDQVEPLRLHWKISCLNDKYKVLQLEDIYEIDLNKAQSGWIQNAQDLFVEKLWLKAQSNWDGLEIRYSTNGKAPDKNSAILKDSLKIEKDTEFQVALFDKNGFASQAESRSFKKTTYPQS